MSPNPDTPPRACVIGWPVDHSLSPVIHGYWLKTLGIEGEYTRLAVAPQDLATTLRALGENGFVGANITVPHKVAALAFMDTVDPLAATIGAVNTVVVGADGELAGSNTDGYGFIENLRSAIAGLDLTRGPAVVLGAGGAARAIVAALADGGAPMVTLVNRTRANAETLAADMGDHWPGRVEVADWDARAKTMAGAALLVNTTTLGMTGKPALDLSLDALPADAVVNDIVYAPLETDLLARARARGNPVVDGLGMLLHQARPGFEAWFGAAPAVTDDLRHHVLATLPS